MFKRVEKKEKYVHVCEEYVKSKSNLRSIAKINNISKSSLHKFIQKELKYMNNELYEKCRKQILFNISVRHIRGGLATKRRYEKNKK